MFSAAPNSKQEGDLYGQFSVMLYFAGAVLGGGVLGMLCPWVASFAHIQVGGRVWTVGMWTTGMLCQADTGMFLQRDAKKDIWGWRVFPPPCHNLLVTSNVNSRVEKGTTIERWM